MKLFEELRRRLRARSGRGRDEVGYVISETGERIPVKRYGQPMGTDWRATGGPGLRPPTVRS